MMSQRSQKKVTLPELASATSTQRRLIHQASRQRRVTHHWMPGIALGDTPLDQQELLCGQLAGVCRCIREMSRSPARLVRLRRRKFAIHMRGDFLWALGCTLDIPDVSAWAFLDHLIGLFRFYNGSIRQSYQLRSKEELASQWSHYLDHLQGGASELHHIFSALHTIDSTHIDPLLLLKAALILQACQRCPLVVAGCISYHGRVVSTQMPPELTAMVVCQRDHQNLDFTPVVNGLGSGGPQTPSASVNSTAVFLSPAELHVLRHPPVDRVHRSVSPLQQTTCTGKPRLLSRTLSDIPEPTGLVAPRASYQAMPCSTDSSLSDEGGSAPRVSPEPARHHFPSPASWSEGQALPHFLANQEPHHAGSPNGLPFPRPEDLRNEGDVQGHTYKDSMSCEKKGEGAAEKGGLGNQLEKLSGVEDRDGTRGTKESGKGNQEDYHTTVTSEPVKEELPLVAMALYRHRVQGLVLALLVEPHFQNDAVAMEEYHSSLASLNGLEAHLCSTPLEPSSAQGCPYTFVYYDRLQNTLATNLPFAGPSVPAGEAQGTVLVKAAAILHTHFSQDAMLQEVILRNAGSAVYGTCNSAQETYFLQQGATVRNSGVPNPQDSAFSLPTKARHKLLKHGLNLL
ncbi:Hermansky-Pudlak syndrome 4 protein isoform X2 [Brienomyrus brachyistius]|uniref:Hermansky-Pudlak syndrome 4 protein isoform X2 n=1 Tax=Brienomyrus brachyistius TaxID=42636 RepID=UPI0020B43D09|nr:Hermansky-Pudlak syndrome 4 protein isoform X2 [Brienomyrus brachyistius]